MGVILKEEKDHRHKGQDVVHEKAMQGVDINVILQDKVDCSKARSKRPKCQSIPRFYTWLGPQNLKVVLG